ncbi:MAG TPA: hypothetical protein PKA63_01555 [Oligoflexia bacterium]|nr:hypothetical protein [Oligoflexia bacterium]HMP47335.1 hypothetical protein [Oligoflexia bacterium]
MLSKTHLSKAKIPAISNIILSRILTLPFCKANHRSPLLLTAVFHRLVLFLFLGMLLFSVSGCSQFGGKSKGNEGAKTAVLQVSIDYLRMCLLANTTALNNYVLLSEYLGNQNVNLQDYHDQVYKLARRWPVSDNPVIQLKVLNVEINDNKAKITFQRDGTKSEFPQVTIELIWIGNSWIVFKDSIFGDNGLYTKYK